jgi:hypothetical protein
LDDLSKPIPRRIAMNTAAANPALRMGALEKH